MFGHAQLQQGQYDGGGEVVLGHLAHSCSQRARAQGRVKGAGRDSSVERVQVRENLRANKRLIHGNQK